MRTHASGLMAGVGDIAVGIGGICAQTIVAGANTLSGAGRVAANWMHEQLSRGASAAHRGFRQALVTGRTFLKHSRMTLTRIAMNPWAWAAAIAAPIAVWGLLNIFSFASDGDRLARSIREHPIVAWTVFGIILALELLVLGSAALTFLRRVYGALIATLRTFIDAVERVYGTLPSDAQAAVRRVPRLLSFALIALQFSAVAVMIWVMASRVPARVWPIVGVVGLVSALLVAFSWIVWRTLGRALWHTLRRVASTFSSVRRGCSMRLRSAWRALSSKGASIVRRLHQLGGAFARLAGTATSSARAVRIEIGWVKHHGSKTPGPKFGISVLDLSIVSVAAISFGIFSASIVEWSGIEIPLFATHRTEQGGEHRVERASPHRPRPMPKESWFNGAGRSLSTAANNASRFLSTAAVLAADKLQDFLGSVSVEPVQTYRGVTPTSYVWSRGSITDIEPTPEAPLQRFAIGAICKFDVVLAVGTASSDGPTAKNGELASARAVSLAHMLATWTESCGTPPKLIAISLGQSSASQPAPSQRSVLIFGLDHAGRLRSPDVDADALRNELFYQPAFAAVSHGYSSFSLCEAALGIGRDGSAFCRPQPANAKETEARTNADTAGTVRKSVRETRPVPFARRH